MEVERCVNLTNHLADLQVWQSFSSLSGQGRILPSNRLENDSLHAQILLGATSMLLKLQNSGSMNISQCRSQGGSAKLLDSVANYDN